MTCVNCGKEIDSKKKFCNLSCFGSYNAKNNPKKKIIKVTLNCKNCNNPTKAVGNIFCSIKCDGQYKKKINDEKCKKLFEVGLLKDRNKIYRILCERDGNQCSECGITEWNNKSIRLWVDHIDGNASNNHPDNFRLICPNCDSQSPTFGAKNWGKGRRSLGLPPYD